MSTAIPSSTGGTWSAPPRQLTTPSGAGHPSPFQLLAQPLHKPVDTVIAVAGFLLWLVLAVFMLLVEFVLYVFTVMTIPLAPFFPLVLPLATGLIVCWFVVGTESLFAALGLALAAGITPEAQLPGGSSSRRLRSK